MKLLSFRTRRALRRLLRLDDERRWNRKYAAGRWDYLDRLDELARYSVLAGYLLRLKPGARVLDVGCGEALLLDHLHPQAYESYVGLDFSEAVRKAQIRANERTRFVVGDLMEYQVDELFDAIVFNESAYYLEDIRVGLRRYETMLAPGGVFLISMVQNDKNEARWLEIDAEYEIVDEVGLRNRNGIEWQVKAFAPPASRP